jgi:predicted lactoylglutathione lyase
MELGQFSVSLNVKDISASSTFYQVLGFEALEGCGSVEDKWLIMQNGTTTIGLFEGMFEHNILTFNPTDARAIERKLVQNGITLDSQTKGNTGPTHLMLKDPDGNVLMFDQHE